MEPNSDELGGEFKESMWGFDLNMELVRLRPRFQRFEPDSSVNPQPMGTKKRSLKR